MNDMKRMRHLAGLQQESDDGTYEIVERLEEIRNEIEELTRESMSLIPRENRERARGYWYAHILSALGESEFMGGSMVTMEDTIQEIAGDM